MFGFYLVAVETQDQVEDASWTGAGYIGRQSLECALLSTLEAVYRMAQNIWYVFSALCSFDNIKEDTPPTGDVISFWLGGTPIIGTSYCSRLWTSFTNSTRPLIVLGSLKAATDILDKRGNIYSSRPRNIMGSANILIPSRCSC